MAKKTVVKGKAKQQQVGQQSQSQLEPELLVGQEELGRKTQHPSSPHAAEDQPLPIPPPNHSVTSTSTLAWATTAANNNTANSNIPLNRDLESPRDDATYAEPHDIHLHRHDHDQYYDDDGDQEYDDQQWDEHRRPSSNHHDPWPSHPNQANPPTQRSHWDSSNPPGTRSPARSAKGKNWTSPSSRNSIRAPSPPAPAPAPASLPPDPSAPPTADDWRTTRVQVKGFSRASGKPPSPPPSAPPPAPAATLLSMMSREAHTMARATLAQQKQSASTLQQNQASRVPMPQPHPYRKTPSLHGHLDAHPTHGFAPGSTGQLAPSAGRTIPRPTSLSRPATSAPPPTTQSRVPTAPVQTKGDPGAYSAWMNWASEAGMVPKVATTVTAQIPPPVPPAASRLGALGGGGQPKIGSSQPQPLKHGPRPGGEYRAHSAPAPQQHQSSTWDVGGTGGGVSVKRKSTDNWPHEDGRWSGGRQQSKQPQDTGWEEPEGSHWEQSQDGDWDHGSRSEGQSYNDEAGNNDNRWDDWSNPHPAKKQKQKLTKQKTHPDHRRAHPEPIQPADSWQSGLDTRGSNAGNRGGGDWGSQNWGAIPEEEGRHDGDDWDDPGEDYDESMHDRNGHRPPPPPNQFDGAIPNFFLQMDPNTSSKTMNFATGRTTTTFELSPPRSGMGENTFHDSHGEALKPAHRALYGKTRMARDRIHWMFPPDRDERVSSLLRWIAAMSNGLATVGLHKFLQEGQRGALIANADFRTPGPHPQPAFDWIRGEDVQPTLDRIFQESVVAYNPLKVVIVFVFLLSQSGNSMACWRRKLPVPEDLKMRYRKEIEKTLSRLEPTYRVFVDELPSKPAHAAHAPGPTSGAAAVATIAGVGETAPVKKKKRRFWGFWRRLFGLKPK